MCLDVCMSVRVSRLVRVLVCVCEYQGMYVCVCVQERDHLTARSRRTERWHLRFPDKQSHRSQH